MTERNLNISELIRANIAKAKEIISARDKAVSLLFNAFDEINEALGRNLEFTASNVIDNDGDEITRVSVSNKNSRYSENLLWYYFNSEKIFPAMFSYQNIITARCESIEDVVEFIKRLVTDENFMIKVVTISSMNNSEDDSQDIPF
ncbi:hypothetical protein AB9K36_26785 [Klebsiella michiganensis]|jgi:hypothetical protein|uniref:Uncharacterized protein n=2 Tax=Klebsiella TaxID=570 RepID=A0ABR5GI77_9ENTR|nr:MULTISPECIES: hypothetical protein [Klebsiella]AKL36322.1 hypothetical protein AB185_21590 [Klebsiella oxytoca]AUW10312.1 hypothetical protein C2U42_14175 [Klebsiella oxytoca]EKW0782499.1 hypothetical protein [Klebsiella michiganensis]EMB9089159.1 hypothetical protein [Klebsiella michiganensis]EMD5183590.1 hypothetical protein [Klebsiella michiganensis]